MASFSVHLQEITIEKFEYEEPLEIEDHSDKEWKANWANLKKFRTPELKEMYAMPFTSQRIRDITLELLCRRKMVNGGNQHERQKL